MTKPPDARTVNPGQAVSYHNEPWATPRGKATPLSSPRQEMPPQTQPNAAPPITPGLYRLHWRAGGTDLAAVGMRQDGARWFAPCSWVTGIVSDEWHLVAGYKAIEVL